jgi:hypothetical protein
MNELIISSGSKSSIITGIITSGQIGKVKLISVTEELGDLTEINLFYNWHLSFRLEGIRATCNIVSLLQTPFPDIYPEDGNAVRNAKILNIEYQNPRFYLRLFKKIGDIYFELGQTVLQNKGMQTQKSLLTPILTDGNIKFLNKTDEIYAEIIDAGYGLFAYNDFVQFELDYSYTITGIKKNLNLIPNNFGKTINSGTPQLILPSNNFRGRLTLTNNGESDISFAYGNQSDCVIGRSPILKPGQTWNDEMPENIYKQAVWGVSHEDSTMIAGIEGLLNGI